MKFKAGDKVRRSSENRSEWWNAKCKAHNFEPDGIFTVEQQYASDDVTLVEFEGIFEQERFELVSSMEEEYQRALKLVGKKIIVNASRHKYVVDNVLLRREKDTIGLSSETIRHMDAHGWVVAVVFNGTCNLPACAVSEAPTEKIVKLNDNHNAVVTKGETSGRVIIGELDMSIDKIKEILDAYNKM